MSRVSSFIRATTADLTFYLPCDADEIAELTLTFRQDGKTVLLKSIEDFIQDDDNTRIVHLRLSQEDTSLFCDNAMATAQMRIVNGSNESLQSRRFVFHVGAAYDDRIMEVSDE